MRDRLDGMRRVLRVQDQIKRSADWRLAEAERAVAEAEAARTELRRFVEEALPAGPLGAAAAAQGGRLDARAAAAARAAASAAEAAREAASRQKLAGRAVEALARDAAAERERRELERLIDAFAARATAPPP